MLRRATKYGQCFTYICGKCPHLSEAKFKEGISLRQNENSAWDRCLHYIQINGK